MKKYVSGSKFGECSPGNRGAFSLPFMNGDFRPISGLHYRARDSINRIHERLNLSLKTDQEQKNTVKIKIPQIKHLLM